MGGRRRREELRGSRGPAGPLRGRQEALARSLEWTPRRRRASQARAPRSHNTTPARSSREARAIGGPERRSGASALRPLPVPGPRRLLPSHSGVAAASCDRGNENKESGAEGRAASPEAGLGGDDSQWGARGGALG